MQNYDTIATLAIGTIFRPICAFFIMANSLIFAQSYTNGPLVVLDPGHGGKDVGTSNGACLEKSICLSICKLTRERLSELMPSAAIYLTRDEDSFIPLAQRSEYANSLDADLFLSIHCNAYPGPAHAARGSETYVMGLHKSDENLEVALRENRSLCYENHELSHEDLATESLILLNHLQDRFLQQSVQMANLVESRFGAQHPGKSKGVKQAGFMVLHQASMPAILIEVGYLSHPIESAYLCSRTGQEEIASMLADAIMAYFEKVPERGIIAAVSETTTRAVKSPEMQYKIQLGALKTDPRKEAKWSSFSDLDIIFDGEVYKIFSKPFPNKDMALAARDQWRSKGFNDAFVVRSPTE